MGEDTLGYILFTASKYVNSGYQELLTKLYNEHKDLLDSLPHDDYSFITDDMLRSVLAVTDNDLIVLGDYTDKNDMYRLKLARLAYTNESVIDIWPEHARPIFIFDYTDRHKLLLRMGD